MHTIDATLVKCDFLFDGVRHVCLQIDPQHTFHYQAGQYVYLLLPNGEKRPYSIANAPQRGAEKGLLEFHIHYHPTDNAFTKPLFDALLSTHTQRLQGPEGHCGYHKTKASHRILLAGGTGLAPCKAIIEAAIEAHDTTALHLYWGARTTQHLYLHTKLQSWMKHYPWFHYTPVLFVDPDATQDYPTGMVHDATINDYSDLTQVEIYASGPAPMVFAAQHRLLKCGLPPHAFFSDYTA